MAKLADAMLGEIPFLSMFTGYFLNPKYLLNSNAGESHMRVTKQPAFFEGKFQLDKLAEFDQVDELTYLMSFIMMLLLERFRG